MTQPSSDALTEFTKTKMHFALALLGTLFALHPFLEKFGDRGFTYLDVEIKVFYIYGLVAGLLALTVYFYALAMLHERGASRMERIGNFLYALSVMILPLYGGLFIAERLAEQVEQVHQKQVAVWGPAVALGLGVLWIAISLLLARRLRKRLGEKDRNIKTEQLADQEIQSLNKAKELFVGGHFDLSVIESWKAIETRLRRVLLQHHQSSPPDNPDVLIQAAARAHLLSKSAQETLHELRRQWNIAVSTEPLTREAAETALLATRNILSTIPIENQSSPAKPRV